MILTVTMSGCSSNNSNQTTLKSASEVMASTLKEVTDTDISVTVSYTEDKYTDNFDRLYGVEKGLVSDGAIAYAELGKSADEISILVAGSEDDVDSLKSALEARIEQRKKDFNGYAPAEVSKLENAVVFTEGRYVTLVICDNPSDVKKELLKNIK